MTDILRALTRLRSDPESPVAIDCETTGLRLEQGDVLRGVAVAIGSEAWYFPLTHPGSDNADRETVAEVLRRAAAGGRTVCMWNGAFDRTAIRRAFGIEFTDAQVWDGLTVDWLMNESADHRLKQVGARVFGLEAKAEKEALDALFRGTTVGEYYAGLRAEVLIDLGWPGEPLKRLPKGAGVGLMERARAASAASKKTWATVTADDIAEYAIQDARLTLMLYEWQQEWLDEHPEYREALAREFAIEGVAYRMRAAGVRVNETLAREALAAALERLEELAALWPGVNLRSAPQVAALVYDTWGLPCTRRTKAGARSTDKLALSALAYDFRVHSLQEFRKLVKQVDAFYVPLLNRVAETGRVHPSWNAHRTVTGRWSCSQPNMQQIPKEKGGVREVFVPAEGMVLVKADLPNAELRIAAILADEPVWLKAFEEGKDLHQVTADAAGITRFQGKTQNYQNLYGGGYKKLAETLAANTGTKPDYAAARTMWRAYWKAIPRVRQLFNGLGEAWVRYGRLPIRPWPGRFRHRLNMRTGFPEAEFKALNSVIQPTIAELVKDWLLLLERKLPDLGGRIVAQVHDSAVLEVPADQVAIAKLYLQSSWDTVNPFTRLPWPLDVEIGF